MSTVPRITRGVIIGTAKEMHADQMKQLQEWIWHCVTQGWMPSAPKSGVWTHDDNQQSMHLGWMITQPPGSRHVDLISLRPGITAPMAMQRIIAGASALPICGKAVAALTAQRLQFPNVKFAFVDSDANISTQGS